MSTDLYNAMLKWVAENCAPNCAERFKRDFQAAWPSAPTSVPPSHLLWSRELLNEFRVKHVPVKLERIVVAINPPVAAFHSYVCGIIVVGLGVDKRAYVLADHSMQGRDIANLAGTAAVAYRSFQADYIVTSAHVGADFVADTIRHIDVNVPVKKVQVTRGKYLRAVPVSTLYAEGRVAHVGVHADLENQMCIFGPEVVAQGRVLSRVDALVWALTDLMLTPKPAVPNFRTI